MAEAIVYLFDVKLAKPGMEQRRCRRRFGNALLQIADLILIISQDGFVNPISLLLATLLEDVFLQEGIHLVVEKDTPFTRPDLDECQAGYLL